MMALAAGVGAALAGSPEQADAQATILSIPHPEGAQVYEVAELSLETQQQIMDVLLQCLRDEFEVADENENNILDDDDEKEFFEEGQVFCAESAERKIGIAKLKAQAAIAEAQITDAEARIADANASIAATTVRAMKDITQSN